MLDVAAGTGSVALMLVTVALPIAAAARPVRRRSPFAFGLVVALVCALLGLPAAASREVSAQEPPPGGLMPSAVNFGSTEGSFSVSHEGAAQYTVPSWAPQGRGNVAPQSGLSYNSRGGNGPLGVSWSLNGLSSSTPCPRTYAEDGLTEVVRFDGSSGLCLAGNRLPPPSTERLPQREYRTEQEMFARIAAYGMADNVTNHFKGGAYTRSASRIDRIVSGGPRGGARELLREHRLTYRDDSITGRSLLSIVTKCDHEGACKLPQQLTWSLGSHDSGPRPVRLAQGVQGAHCGVRTAGRDRRHRARTCW